MLGKLLKYEFRATGRILLPLYGTMLIFSLLNRGALAFLPAQSGPFTNLINVLLMVIYVSIICATAFMTLFLMAQRFYKNLLGDEGYLMFTLPVPVWKNISSKLIVSVAWSLLSAVVTFLSVFIVAVPKDFFKDFLRLLFELKQWLIAQGFPVNFHLALYVVEFLLTAVISLACSVLILYAAISIGHLFQRHRMMFSFAAFIGITTLLEILSYFVLRIADRFDFNWLFAHLDEAAAIHLFFGGLFLTLLVGSAVFFFVTNYILKNRLNLE